MTRELIEKGKISFQPVTTKILPTAKNSSILSSIFIPRKPSPVTTDWIHNIVDNNGRDIINAMCGGGNKTKVLANKCVDLDRACNKYF